MSVPPDIRLALQLLTALVFVAAAAGKMRHWLAFQGVLANYRLLPEALVRPAAYLLPPVELAIAAGVLTPRLQLRADAAGAAALLLFGAAMAVNLARGRAHIDCGCFQSTLKQALRWQLVARNAALAAALLWLAFAGAAGAPATALDTPVLLNGLLGGGALFALWQGSNLLWSLVPGFRPQRAPAHTHLEETT
jgi:hypothetical protein